MLFNPFGIFCSFRTGWLFTAFLLGLNTGFCQNYNLPLNNDLHLRYETLVNRVNADFHTEIRPYRMDELKATANTDSIEQSFFKKSERRRTWVHKQYRRENFIRSRKEKYTLFVDPLLNFSYYQDLKNKADEGYQNTRGFVLGGTIGKNIGFFSSFAENQATFPSYVDQYIDKSNVVPGGGYPKKLGKAYDFGVASGYVSYSPGEFFNIQFGHDKNFIGEGYRSILLSDNAFSYPSLKITTTVGKFKYLLLYTQMLDLQNPRLTFNNDDFLRKYVPVHYLSINLFKRLSIGFFEAVVLRAQDSTSYRGFDWNYLNPVIFMRPVEYYLGSSDNALMGVNGKLKFSNHLVLYGQFMLDEFRLKEVLASNGWYANKQSFQAGFKALDLFNFKNLIWKSEFNYIRPFMYTHYKKEQNYAHYGQELAHPMGANLWEVLTFLSYRLKSWYAEARYSVCQYGDGVYNPATKKYESWGRDIFLSYYDHRPGDYGYFVGKGDRKMLSYLVLRGGYVINPRSNLVIEGSITQRKLINSPLTTESLFIQFGLRTSLFNFYHDF